MMGLDNADKRRALRSVVQAILMLGFLALLWWIVDRRLTDGSVDIAKTMIYVIGLSTLFYGAENVTRAIKVETPLGSFDLGEDAKIAAHYVADKASSAADEIEEKIDG